MRLRSFDCSRCRGRHAHHHMPKALQTALKLQGQNPIILHNQKPEGTG